MIIVSSSLSVRLTCVGSSSALIAERLAFSLLARSAVRWPVGVIHASVLQNDASTTARMESGSRYLPGRTTTQTRTTSQNVSPFPTLSSPLPQSPLPTIAPRPNPNRPRLSNALARCPPSSSPRNGSQVVRSLSALSLPSNSPSLPPTALRYSTSSGCLHVYSTSSRPRAHPSVPQAARRQPSYHQDRRLPQEDRQDRFPLA
jgi:hypothetical protein